MFSGRHMQRREDETLNRFHTCLRELATKCQFGDINKEIKIQLLGFNAKRSKKTSLLALLACSRLSVEEDDQKSGRVTSDEQGLVEKKRRLVVEAPSRALSFFFSKPRSSRSRFSAFPFPTKSLEQAMALWKRSMDKFRNQKAFNNLASKLTTWIHRKVVFLLFFFGGGGSGVAIFRTHKEDRLQCPASRKTRGHCGKMGHFAHVYEIKFGASRNLLKHRTPRPTTSSEGARYKPQNSVTQWMLLIPVLMKQVSCLTAMIRNSSSPSKGQQQYHLCNSPWSS